MFYCQDALKPGYLKNLPVVLKQFSDFLGEGKWFAGDKVLFIVVVYCCIISIKQSSL